MFDTTFKKGGLKRVLGALILGVLMLIAPFFSLAQSYPPLIVDSFESYNLGNLTGQGDWEQYDSIASLLVSDEEPVEGSKSIKGVLTVDSGNYIIGEDLDLGSQSIWLNISAGSFGMRMLENADNKMTISGGIWGEEDVKISRYVGGGSVELCIVEDAQGEWIDLRWEWNADTDRFRYNCNFEGWTDWELPFTAFSIINKFGIVDLSGSGLNYFDYLGSSISNPPCQLGYCKYCETYTTCSNAGCYWYFSIYLQSYYCVEPYEAEEEDCGSFYKCQFCLTQTPCELELNCEWVDRGFGEKCYMIEPEIPPEQVGWEAPTLEDCGELSGVEKWLCEIKNFIAGIFMPSQEALDKLYNTIGSFKNKFPFNYIGALNSFFDDVKDSLDEEKEIPVKILGQEGNVDFSFWTTTAPIGGVSESLGNVLLDFTSLIILLAWFVWLISFIKRFF